MTPSNVTTIYRDTILGINKAAEKKIEQVAEETKDSAEILAWKEWRALGQTLVFDAILIAARDELTRQAMRMASIGYMGTDLIKAKLVEAEALSKVIENVMVKGVYNAE